MLGEIKNCFFNLIALNNNVEFPCGVLVVGLDQLPLERKEVEKFIIPRKKNKQNVSCALTINHKNKTKLK